MSSRYSRLLTRAQSTTIRLVSGMNTDTDSGDDVWAGSSAYTGFLAAATAIEAISGDANDHATTNPTGARTIRVEGLDANWDHVTEDLAMAGTSASAHTTAEFIRVTAAYVLTAGSSGTNEGAITVRTSDGSTTLAVIAAGTGRAQQAIVSIPRRHIAVVRSLFMSSNATAAGTPARMALLARPGADQSDAAVRRVTERAGIVGGAPFNRVFEPGAIVLPEKSDLWVRTIVGASDNVSTVELEVELLQLEGGQPVPDPSA